MLHPTEEQTVEVRSIIDKNPSEMTVKIAENMGLPEVAVVEALPEYMRVAVPCENFESIWQEMSTWEKVTFIITNNGAIVEVVGKLPKGKFGHGFFNLHQDGIALRGHLKISELGAIWLISKPFFNMESHSAQFFHKKGDLMFGVYVGRDQERRLIKDVRTAFINLWTKYGLE